MHLNKGIGTAKGSPDRTWCAVPAGHHSGLSILGFDPPKFTVVVNEGLGPSPEAGLRKSQVKDRKK